MCYQSLLKKVLVVVFAAVAVQVWSQATTASGGPPDKSPITFTKDVAPILQKSCQECHHEGGVAPMPLVTYEQVRPWARAIKERVVQRRMPPFDAAGEIGHYQDDPRLTDAQIALVSSWVDAGAPRGNPADLPAPLKWEGGWQSGKPDLVISPAKPFTVKANTSDDYQLFVLDYVFPENTWVRGIVIRPGNTKVVHHATLYVLPPDVKAAPDGRAENADSFIVSGAQAISTWVPGSSPNLSPPGYASVIPKGARFGIQIHYAPTDTEAVDKTLVGFYLADGLIQKQAHAIYGVSSAIEIPPGEPNYQVIRRKKFTEDALVLGFHVHMHLRGKSFTVSLIYPDGRTEKVFEVPRYNFNWQRFYKLAQPIHVPKGTVADFTAIYDNSAKNPFNPDPTQVVHFGERTTDEMMGGTIVYEVPDERLNIVVKNGHRITDLPARGKN